MSSRPDVIACWRAANEIVSLNLPDQEYSPADLIEYPTRHRVAPGHDQSLSSRGLVFSLIISDEDDDHGLDRSLSSLLENDLSCAQILLTGPRRRESELVEVLNKRGASATVDLHITEDEYSFAEAQASALRVTRGEFVGFLSAGDLIEPNAIGLLEAVALHEFGADIIFTDEDWTDEKGNKCCPRLKTGWDPDSHLGRDHFGQLCLLRRSRVEEVGGLHVEYAPAEQYDLHCRIAFSTSPLSIRHVPLILCHRAIPQTDASGGDASEAFLHSARHVAQLAAEQLCGEAVTVTSAPLAPFINRIHWPLPEQPPLVSILVPTRDRADLVRNCVEGLLARTVYNNFEILILDNDSTEAATFRLFAELSADRRIRVVPAPGPFNFSRINNDGVLQARGEILVFMNNDVEVGEGDWLREMVSHALRPDVGCVGARLLYRDRHVQHAGIVLKPGPLAMHVFRRRHESELGFDAQLAGTRTYVAVTAACLALRRSVFDCVGGFDERDLQGSFQDVDLCLKIEEIGFRNICTPFEPLLHLEGSSRSADVTPEKQARERRELSCLVHRWNDRFHDDRFGHPLIDLDWENPERIVPLPPGINVLDLVR